MILIGQDESIYKQFSITAEQWALLNIETVPNPKEEGQGVMLSSFVLCDFGYGHNLTEAQLDQINDIRRGTDYLDEDAAMNIYGNKTKNELTCSPFEYWLEYGQNNKGYWNYDHMVIQFEDVIDVLNVLYHTKRIYLTNLQDVKGTS